MDPTTFRRDPWLRTSGYHLATWSLVALALELERRAPGDHAFVAAAILASALLISMTHERRIGKMAGVAGDPVYRDTAVVWRLVMVGLAAAVVASLAAPAASALFPVSMVIVGIGFAQWGAGADFAWFVGLGAFMVAAALADVVVGAHAPWLRPVVLGLVLPAIGVETSRRFLWFRADPNDPAPTP